MDMEKEHGILLQEILVRMRMEINDMCTQSITKELKTMLGILKQNALENEKKTISFNADSLAGIISSFQTVVDFEISRARTWGEYYGAKKMWEIVNNMIDR